MHATLADCHASVQEAVKRALEWIGRGLCRRWPGDALRDYSTALDILLTIPNEVNRRVLLPYRMLALATLNEQSMIHPAAVCQAYERRSVVVHEGRVDAEAQPTTHMRSAARDCVGWLAKFASSAPSEDHATLLTALDTPNGRAAAINWLERFPDPWSQHLVRGITNLRK